MKRRPELTLRIDKLVHGGQGIGTSDDGRKVLVWGALPGELVRASIFKNKSSYAEAVATEVFESSPDRIPPREPDIYISTSPWQILDYDAEARSKQAILSETFQREQAPIAWKPLIQPDQPYAYRNKMEYNFWFDTLTEQVSLALHKRGSHQKIPVGGSALAMTAVELAGKELIWALNDRRIEARPIKSVILRSTADGRVGMSLFVQDQNIVDQLRQLPLNVASYEVVATDSRSPASIATEALWKTGETYLADDVLGRSFRYTTRSFFQVNIPMYEAALREMKPFVREASSILDLYSGVGSISLSIAEDSQKLTLIEQDSEATAQSLENAGDRGLTHIVTADSLAALKYISGHDFVIVDPPRAGMHAKVTAAIIAGKHRKIAYLSCNPSTQARDIRLLIEGGYRPVSARGFNFFPRTPHIESLVLLEYSGV